VSDLAFAPLRLVQKRTDEAWPIDQHESWLSMAIELSRGRDVCHQADRDDVPRREDMLLIIGTLVALTALVNGPRLWLWLRLGTHAENKGWMSERWLAEYHASHP
jgi:hypothetical protein